jgi:hypothetical protein
MAKVRVRLPGRKGTGRGLMAALLVLLGASLAAAQEPLTGSLSIHDPSTMIKQGGRYYIFATGNNIASKSSADKMNWSSGLAVFSSPPSWTTSAVPGFGGTFWAPDVIYLNGLYRLYYSVSTFGSQISTIGLVTNPTLDPADPNYLWTDQGAVIQSSSSVNYNAIDPSVMLAADGRLWMTFGSFWTGIKMIQLDPATGKRITPTSTVYSLATHPPSTAIEGSCLIQRSNYYYLFVNWDTCCSGVDSTYNIRVGRSASVTGPYLDHDGVSLASGGGTMFLESTARFIGPGHAGVMPEGETNWFTYHYYDGNNNGNSKLGMGRLYWTDDGWPALTNDWSAFYTFDVDAREHLAQYNGTLRNGAAIINEAGRGKVLGLTLSNQFVTLPISVANASTFAAWVKWDGGADWQRIFDFGNGTNKYLFLTPRANTGKMRFAIKNGGAEQTLDAPTALPTNSWCQVAVALDGAKGVLYLNGNPVGTNAGLTIRPWQVLARSNYVGESQFTADPTFSGRIDSFRIFGRPLSSSEIKDLAYAHPALAHRYSFTSNAWDSIGMAHGVLMGNASVTNGALHLTGASGGYVNLPGGLVSGSSAVTIEFWAAFGVNGNWARVFDFGNISGTNGSQYLFFSPHTGTGTHHTEISSSSTVNLDIPGTLDNRSLFVACIVDPTNGYTAIYTNGVLEKAATNTLPALSSVNASWSFIGRSLFSADAWLNATIDEFRIYDGRLTPEEIATDYSFGPDALALPVSLVQSNSPIALNLSWPSYAVGFVPESSSDLGDAAIWAPLTQSLTLNNDRWQLALPTTNAAQFYRLRR